LTRSDAPKVGHRSGSGIHDRTEVYPRPGVELVAHGPQTSKHGKTVLDEPVSSRTLPLNKLVSNRDKALRKARDLFEQGKLDEARRRSRMLNFGKPR
jgi:hypothetical protein